VHGAPLQSEIVNAGRK